MNLKQLKLNRLKSNAGFTLVELIVVIAILAILGGIGVPAYSGYVKKANMQVDQTLVSEVKKAMELAYYSGLFADDFTGGSVTLSLDGTETGDEALAAAMEKAFGSEWENLQLKYDGWINTQGNAVAALGNSSFSDGNGGVKQELLGTVDNLTKTLSGLMSMEEFAINNYESFSNYLTENGIDYSTDPQKAANSIVPYLSMETAVGTEARANMKESLVTHDSWIVDGKLDVKAALIATVINTEDNRYFPSLAATYATMKGFCEWADAEAVRAGGASQNLSALFDSIPLDKYWDEDVGDSVPVMRENHVVMALQQALDGAGYSETMAPLFEQYLSSGAAERDVDAYFGVIDSIADNKDYIMENLDNSENFYSDRAGYLNTYLDVSVDSGDIAVIVTLGPNGAPEIGAVGMGTAE